MRMLLAASEEGPRSRHSPVKEKRWRRVHRAAGRARRNGTSQSCSRNIRFGLVERLKNAYALGGERGGSAFATHPHQGGTMDQSGSTGGQGAPTGPTSGWSAPPPPPAQPGPKGFVYADVPNRAIAYIIDAIILGIVNLVVFAILGGVGLRIYTFDLVNGFQYNYLFSIIYAVIGLAISGGYF